jgi:1-deoxy-D-xylulose-5-phosphate synthase
MALRMLCNTSAAENNEIVPVASSSSRAYTNVVSDAIHAAMQANPRVSVLTAAMCAGNNLNRIRTEFPDRFFDTGICEGHAVAFAAGMAKAGMRPIVDIYSISSSRKPACGPCVVLKSASTA